MVNVLKTIHVEPGSEVDRLLDEAAAGPISLERHGERYRLDRVSRSIEGDVWAGYSAERAIANMRAAAGSWADIDAEDLKAYIYRARDEGTRPLDGQ
jgi:hypothetical protein